MLCVAVHIVMVLPSPNEGASFTNTYLIPNYNACSSVMPLVTMIAMTLPSFDSRSTGSHKQPPCHGMAGDDGHEVFRALSISLSEVLQRTQSLEGRVERSGTTVLTGTVNRSLCEDTPSSLFRTEANQTMSRDTGVLLLTHPAYLAGSTTGAGGLEQYGRSSGSLVVGLQM
ncbi:hypothetical protein BR93DRAFT_926553 [Coniochaeta sp. PMI_546]|nr:hypothetical protein BR93DRAFT_926553 [Coniochaeta sp. PMI_546]